MRKILSFLSCVLLVRSTMPRAARAQAAPKTPIQHLVVIFGENESFDHYFGNVSACTEFARRAEVHGFARYAGGKRTERLAADQ
jgi:phospholipase C